MKEQQKDNLETLRAVKTAFTLAISDKGAGSVLTEDEELKIMQKLVKQRKESADIYRNRGGRTWLKRNFWKFPLSVLICPNR